MLKFKWETDFEQKIEIGNVPRDWEYKELETIAEVDKSVKPISGSIEVGFIAMEGIATDSYIPSFEATNLENIRSGREVLPNSVLMAKITPSFEHGKMCIVPNVTSNRWFATTEVFSINPTNGHDLKFIFYLLKHPILRDLLENSMSGTSGRQRVQSSALKNLRVPYPSSSEQSRIGSILSWFDDLVENKKKQNEILEKTAMAIFKSWFIDFEPFKDDEFIDSEIGKIPKGWEVDYVTRIIEFNPKANLKEGQIHPFVEMKNVPINSMVCKYDFKEYAGSGVRFYGGDTLLARITPCLENGKTPFVWFIDKNQVGFGTTEFIVMRAKQNRLIEFVYLLARSEEFREHAINSMSGTSGRQRVEKEALEMFRIPIPPFHVIQEFHFLIEPLFQRIILNQKQIMTLKRAKDALLPLLVFGKLRVEEI